MARGTKKLAQNNNIIYEVAKILFNPGKLDTRFCDNVERLC